MERDHRVTDDSPITVAFLTPLSFRALRPCKTTSASRSSAASLL
jgi:hypothetical protein